MTEKCPKCGIEGVYYRKQGFIMLPPTSDLGSSRPQHWVDSSACLRRQLAHEKSERSEIQASYNALWTRFLARGERVEELEAVVEEIRQVACGEEQVADDDGDGMLWIFKRCEAAQAAEKGSSNV